MAVKSALGFTVSPTQFLQLVQMSLLPWLAVIVDKKVRDWTHRDMLVSSSTTQNNMWGNWFCGESHLIGLQLSIAQVVQGRSLQLTSRRQRDTGSHRSENWLRLRVKGGLKLCCLSVNLGFSVTFTAVFHFFWSPVANYVQMRMIGQTIRHLGLSKKANWKNILQQTLSDFAVLVRFLFSWLKKCYKILSNSNISV